MEAILDYTGEGKDLRSSNNYISIEKMDGRAAIRESASDSRNVSYDNFGISELENYISSLSRTIIETGIAQYIPREFKPDFSLGKISLIDLPTVYDKARNKLRQFEPLENGWDGEGSIAPSEETLATANLFLDILSEHRVHTPGAMLSHDGEISFFWNLENCYAEAIIESEGGFSYLIDSVSKGAFGEDDVPLENFLSSQLYNHIA